MRTVAIIQVRMGSQRLLGKALMEIGHKSVLRWVVHRVRMIQGLDGFYVATSNLSIDDPIAEHCNWMDYPCFRGSANDVLDRYYQCATEYEATHILRITADCPLLDPVINSRIVEALHAGEAEYVSATTRSNGFVQEAFTFEALQRAHQDVVTDSDKEHVVPRIIRNEKTLFLHPGVPLGEGRFCVDTRDDFERLRALYGSHPDLFDLPAQRIVRLAEYELPQRAYH
jgi:spore coat polysaccharide biosynthesis protein SpsF